MPTMDERQEVKSLKKALRALTFLNCHGESTVTEVACAIGVPRTTSYRLLETLAAEGYVEKQPHSNIYRLTSMVQKLSSGFGGCDFVVELAKPLINKVAGDILWPIALATPLGCDMMVRIATDHDTPVAIDRYMIGFRTPMLHAPAGFCYLAFCEDSVRESVLDLVNRNCSSAEDKNAAEDMDVTLAQVRRLGFCHIRFPQYREGGLAVPLSADGKIVGGIVMRYMKTSMKSHQVEERYVPIMKKLAADISATYDRRINAAASEQAPDSTDVDESVGDAVISPAPYMLFGRAGPAVKAPSTTGLRRAWR